MGTRSGQEAPEDRDCEETGIEGKAKELEPGPKEEGGQQEVFAGEVQQLSFLRQGHMGLVIPLVTYGVVGDGRGRKTGQAQESLGTEVSGLSCLSHRAPGRGAPEPSLTTLQTPLTLQSSQMVQTLFL